MQYANLKYRWSFCPGWWWRGRPGSRELREILGCDSSQGQQHHNWEDFPGCHQQRKERRLFGKDCPRWCLFGVVLQMLIITITIKLTCCPVIVVFWIFIFSCSFVFKIEGGFELDLFLQLCPTSRVQSKNGSLECLRFQWTILSSSPMFA